MDSLLRQVTARNCLLLTLVFASATPLQAGPPGILNIFRKKQPLSDQSLELKAEHGPWLILAATMTGDEGKSQATALAKELREVLDTPAFVMEKTIGESPTLATRERIKTDSQGNLRPYELEIRYANGGQDIAYVVLVGEFTSIDDPRIQETLQAVRTARPKSLPAENQPNGDTTDGEDSNWLVQKYRSLLWTRTDRKDDFGRMGAAFVTRNPLLPDDYFEAPKLDDFVADLNKNVEYSLLDCPGKFTVRVASFTGKQVTDFGNGARASKMSDTTDALDKAALTAHELTMALRKKGEEAYEFHDRYGSYVMVGSFDSLGQEMSSGQFQYHPGITATLSKWCGYRVVDAKDPRTGAVGKTTTLNSLEKIPFDIEGKPMAVPRVATSNLYRNSLLGGR